ncbi:hypothetical protein HMPREF9712_01418 [Myroides odoratimimus CCUG 10230]|uniref:Uncharacterized protein n=1 Tax=Myroides odoratimimus CCUG 10230 TaxID=883150 RepID=A0ABP2NC48_9FLAO|nr:hypothetical protein HMPREF9712_01418 [Myroides odoratimimus CCUG 10230]
METLALRLVVKMKFFKENYTQFDCFLKKHKYFLLYLI